MLEFNWTVDVGNLLTVAGIIGAGAVSVYRICARLDVIDQRMTDHEKVDMETRDDVREIRLHLMGAQELRTRRRP